MILFAFFAGLLAQIGIDIGPLPSDVIMAGIVVGSLIPMLIAAINRRSIFTGEVKAILAFLCCAAGALILCWFSGYFTGRDVLSMILVVFFVSQFLYKTFYQPSGITDAIDRTTG